MTTSSSHKHGASGFVEMVRRANRPGPPEDSIALRIAAGGTVVVGIAACAYVHELSSVVALTTASLVGLGMWFSYRTRTHPALWVKGVLALAVVIAFGWFFLRVTSIYLGMGSGSGITAVEGPLATLFAIIQVTHSFDVPARRDLSFSLAGSTSLMAVAGAQAIDIGFGAFVLAWAALGLWGLFASWSSATGGGRVSWRMVGGSLGALCVLTFSAILILPAPHVASVVSFPSSASHDTALANPTSLAGDSGQPSEPSKPGSATNGHVGGYLGFSQRLDTSIRASLGSQVVMRVRAQLPSYWIGETFSNWNGTSWTDPKRQISRDNSGPPFNLVSFLGSFTGAGSGGASSGNTGGQVPPAPGDAGTPDLQTFYLANGGPNLIFHAPGATEVWFPSDHIFASTDDTLIAPLAMGPGTVYTVESTLTQPTPDELRRSGAIPDALDPNIYDLMTQLPPNQDPRIAALAKQVTAAQPDVYDKVESLISWIGHNTRYSTDIPAPPPGEDAVSAFLFGNREGFCEQISTALAVMLRTLGIPAREAVGYVPGPYNPLTDLWEVQARDAHAWVQVWFPGYGWQSFDPTASVPLANPSPGQALLSDTGHVLGRLPWTGISLVVVAAATIAFIWRRRRQRPGTWAESMAQRIEQAGAKAGLVRQRSETLSEYATRLDAAFADRFRTWQSLAALIEENAYAGREPSLEQRRSAESALASKRVKVGTTSSSAPGG